MKAALRPMRPLVSWLLGCTLALAGKVFSQEQFSEPQQQPTVETELHPDTFLDPSSLFKRYEDALEGLFDRDEDVQTNAIKVFEQLIAPIEFPDEYIVTVDDDSAPWDTQQGDGASQKDERLIDIMEDTAKGSVAEAAFILGVLAATGVSPVVQQNDARANRMYALAANYGSVSGHLAMAHRYEQGFNVPKSCSIAYSHLKVAALTFAQQADDLQAYQQKPRQVVLRERARTAAYLSDADHLFSSDNLLLEQELADRGDLEAIQRVAFRQLLGLGVEPNVAEAVRAFEGAAQVGDPHAMLNLGLLHSQGINGVVNHTRAHELFHAAARADLPAAWNGLGHLHLNGFGVDANATIAMHYFAKGAALGDPDALYNLALVHMYGLGGVPVNATSAQLLLKDAHSLQQFKAPLLLAELHAEFDELPGGKDCNLAMQYLWVFVDERSDWSEASFDALEMATGVKQDGGSSDMVGQGHGAHDENTETLPHDPRRAALLYTVLSEQGSLAAAINAAWLLERSDESEFAGGRRNHLIRYLYTRAALADSSHAQVDYANWLLKSALSDNENYREGAPETPEGPEGRGGPPRGAPGPGSGSEPRLWGGPPPRERAKPLQLPLSTQLSVSEAVADAEAGWAVLLRMGLSGGRMHDVSGKIEQAMLLYSRAKRLEDPEAATNLAWMHAAGVGFQKNLTAATEEYRAAIRIASTEAERLAPRVAVIALNVWVFLRRLLPGGAESALERAAGSLLESLGESMDQVEAVTAPFAAAWARWLDQL